MVEFLSNKKEMALPGALDISTVSLLHNNIDISDSNEISYVVNAAGVQKITSPGIQLLVSLFKTIGSERKQLLVDNCSEQMNEAFRDFGLLDLLKKWSKQI